MFEGLSYKEIFCILDYSLPGWVGPKPGASSRSLVWVHGPKALVPPLLFFQEHQQEIELEMEHPGLELRGAMHNNDR